MIAATSAPVIAGGSKPASWSKSIRATPIEHAFARTWSAMKGYHLLMRMAHLFNTLARFAQHRKAFYAELGVRGVITFIRDTCKSPWLDAQRIRDLIERPLLLRLQ